MAGATGSIPVAPTTQSSFGCPNPLKLTNCSLDGDASRDDTGLQERFYSLMDLVSPIPNPLADSAAQFIILRPPVQTVPLVVASPHSGRAYAPEFLKAARLGPLDLRRSEDSFVEELFESAVVHGAPLLCAQFPRAFCDPNREAWELDPTMFADALPDWVNTTSPRVGAGLGTIARVVTSGESIYRGKLQFADAQTRVRECWQPYHDALAGLIADTQLRFDCCLLIDCHSMPVAAGRYGGPDFVLGDAHSTACSPQVTALVERVLRDFGYDVRRNDPYAGGYVTRHYGRPRNGVHALQIEVARRLYMDESKLERSDGFGPLRSRLDSLMEQVAASCTGILAPTKKEGGAFRHRQV